MDPNPLYKSLLGICLGASCVLGSSCVSYEAAPLELATIWSDLASVTLPAANANGFTPIQLAAFAAHHHPALAKARAEAWVGESELDEAGLWPSLEVGWGAMDSLASEWSAGHTKTDNFVSGLDLMLELPRPGELDAKTDVAFWRNKKLRQAVLEAEWRLARQVQAACVELEIAQLLLAQSTTLLEVTDRSRDYFAAAVEVGAATATEASLAAADSLLIRADSLGQESRMRRGRRDLNGLLGLPPEYLVPLAPRASWGLTGLDVQLEELQMEALEQRPDLWVAEAHYEVAEAELQLEIALQFPRIAIGTGLQISPGFPGGFNRAAIESATRRRAVAASELALEVHQIRAEVFDAQADYLDAKALCAMLKTELVANAEASLAHAQAAFEAGQVTLLETLNVQRSLVAAHARLNAARADELRAATNLLTVTGRLSGTTTEQPR